MEYAAMSAKELQDECARRGLASARTAKAVMAQRLLDDDASAPGDVPTAETHDEGGILASVMAEAVNDSAAPEPVAPVIPVAAPATPGAFRMDFPAEPGGPDEEAHLSCRQATLQAATEAGCQTRGDARRTGTVNGRWVYEVSVRSPR